LTCGSLKCVTIVGCGAGLKAGPSLIARPVAAAKRRSQHGGHGGFTETTEKKKLEVRALFVFSVASAGLRELCVELLFFARHQEVWK
jgi:hypothetical protein